MPALASFFIVLIISLLIVRVASVALSVTGMGREAARFEARSAWTGTGFTSSESEQVVYHPVSRRIITFLMILRSAGLVGAVSTLILSFMTAEKADDSGFEKLLVLLAGLTVLWLVSQSKIVDRWLTNFISRVLTRFTDLDTRDFSSLLRLGGDYTVQEVEIGKDNWMAGKTLFDLNLRDEGILMLGINRPDMDYIGVPPLDMQIEAGDNIVLYGREKAVMDLARRSAPESAFQHKVAVRQQTAREKEQKKQVQSAGSKGGHAK